MADYSIKYNTKDIKLNDKDAWGEATEVKPVGDLKYSGKFGDSIWAVNAVPNSGVLTYRVHCMEDGGKWLGEVDSKDNDGNKTYAGTKEIKIDAFAIKSNSHQLVYRVHVKGDNKWLNWVMKYDIEKNDGYAGMFGKEIDAIQIMPLPNNNN